MVIEGVLTQGRVLARLLRSRSESWFRTVVDDAAVIRQKRRDFIEEMKDRSISPGTESYIDAYFGLLSSFVHMDADILMRAGVEKAHIDVVQSRYQQESLLAEGVIVLNVLLLARERHVHTGEDESFYRMLKECLDQIGVLSARIRSFEEIIPRVELDALRAWVAEYECRNPRAMLLH